MRWESGRQSENVEDRRGVHVSRRVAGGGIGTILLVLVALYFGVDPSIILNQGQMPFPGAGAPTQSEPYSAPPEEQELAQFVSVVLAETEDTWKALFRNMGKTYEEPKLVLFSQAVESACGMASAAMGPFYCPMDQKVYIDLSFYNDMKNRFGAPGDFAQAYVIAHEVGHHVQNLLGIAEKVHSLRSRASETEANKLSVMMELQADGRTYYYRPEATGRLRMCRLRQWRFDPELFPDLSRATVLTALRIEAFNMSFPVARTVG